MASFLISSSWKRPFACRKPRCFNINWAIHHINKPKCGLIRFCNMVSCGWNIVVSHEGLCKYLVTLQHRGVCPRTEKIQLFFQKYIPDAINERLFRTDYCERYVIFLRES